MTETLLTSIAAVSRMLAYDRWANRRALASLLTVEDLPDRVLLWMPHIVGAQSTWLDRLQGVQSNVPIWPQWSMDDTALQLDALNDRWQAWINTTPPPDLHTPIAYENSQGMQYTDTAADIVQHVLLHSHYHRGQIAAEIRAARGTPAISDFITALRDPDYTGPTTPGLAGSPFV